MHNEIQSLHRELKNHTLYSKLNSVESIQIFMKWHSYAVWDFMSLLKALQNKITCTSLPWRPSSYSKELVRFINEIVLGEESDVDKSGNFTDHFSMYLNAMSEIGVNTTPLLTSINDLDFSDLPHAVRNFVQYNIDLALNGEDFEVASAFFYGRENLVPDIFNPIVSAIENNNIHAPSLKYYLERHIELDGDEHSHLAQKCLDILVNGDEEKYLRAFNTAKTSLILREKMWSFIVGEIDSQCRKGEETSL